MLRSIEPTTDCEAQNTDSNDLAVIVAAATVVIILTGMAGYIKEGFIKFI